MDGLTQDGLAYCGLTRGGASNTEWQGAANLNGQAGGSGEKVMGLVQTIANDDCRRSLAQTIEAEIIPRLMVLHGALPGLKDELTGPDAAPAPAKEMDEAVHFCDLMLGQSAQAGNDYVDAMLGKGIALEQLYLNLFAPAARRLGELWEADLCNFSDVTIALGRLQQVLHTYSPVFCADGEVEIREHRALLVSVPGEQHTLGLFMVSEFFRRSGWGVSGEPAQSIAALTSIVAAEWFDVVGLSAGSHTRIEVVRDAVQALRRASLNRDLCVMVGGPIFIAAPELVADVGADAMAMDAKQAVETADALVANRPPRGK